MPDNEWVDLSDEYKARFRRLASMREFRHMDSEVLNLIAESARRERERIRKEVEGLRRDLMDDFSNELNRGIDTEDWNAALNEVIKLLEI